LPGRDFREEAAFLEGPPAAAELARLQWQARSIGLLLLERASDAVEAVMNRRKRELAQPGIGSGIGSRGLTATGNRFQGPDEGIGEKSIMNSRNRSKGIV
jgi:hypothetical protein